MRKKQYVAILDKDLSLKFISELSDFSRSGANARMETDLSWVKDGTLIVVKDGSHKHMSHAVYRLKNGVWQRVCIIEDTWSWSDAKNKLFERFLLPEIQQLVKPLTEKVLKLKMETGQGG
jgi:hypothetical protein